jgi:N-acetylmuramoyl-L-alanine amidase
VAVCGGAGDRSLIKRVGKNRILLALIVVATTVAGLLTGTPSSSETPAPGEAVAQVSGLRTIVIDPGHGGLAVGTAGPNGMYEKEITLDIAARLRELIYRRLGLQVILTREADIDVDNIERTEKANYWNADLFISIHANSYRASEIRGPETYFLSDRASDAMARAAAEQENGTVMVASQTEQSEPGDPALEFILWDLAQTQHLRASSLLAETIQNDLTRLWGLPDRGVKQAPFTVLRGATMPAVLVEVGYLSNPQDAAALTDPEFRQRIAESLYRSITGFRERYATLVDAPPPAP